MSQYECVVPEMEWNLRQQRQEQVEGSEEKQKRNHHQHYNIDNNNSTSSSHLRPWFQQNLHPIMYVFIIQYTDKYIPAGVWCLLIIN